MTPARRTPPGRAGRLRLRHSLDVAERGADLLERKLRILRAEHERLLRAEAAAAGPGGTCSPRPRHGCSGRCCWVGNRPSARLRRASPPPR